MDLRFENTDAFSTRRLWIFLISIFLRWRTINHYHDVPIDFNEKGWVFTRWYLSIRSVEGLSEATSSLSSLIPTLRSADPFKALSQLQASASNTKSQHAILYKHRPYSQRPCPCQSTCQPLWAPRQRQQRLQLQPRHWAMLWYCTTWRCCQSGLLHSFILANLRFRLQVYLCSRWPRCLLLPPQRRKLNIILLSPCGTRANVGSGRNWPPLQWSISLESNFTMLASASAKSVNILHMMYHWWIER